MSYASALLAGRRAAESLMVDFGAATRPTGETTYDPETQAQVPEMDPDFGFESVAKLQVRTMQPRDEEVGGRTATTLRMELHLPADTEPLTTGDLWTFTEVDPLSTTPLDSVWRVLSPVGKTFATARRYEVEAVVA